MTRATGWGWLLMWVTLAVGCGESSPVDMWISRDPDAGAGFEAPVRDLGSADVPEGDTTGTAGAGGGAAGSDGTAGSGGAGGSAGSDGAGSGGSGGSGGTGGDGANP